MTGDPENYPQDPREGYERVTVAFETTPEIAALLRSGKLGGFSVGGSVRREPGPSVSPYAELGLEVGKLVEEKQAAYGDSFGRAGRVLAILYPDGVSPEQYPDMLAVVRIIDKLFRIATRKDAFGESPFRDIAGYGLLGAMRDERAKPLSPSVHQPPQPILEPTPK